MRNIKEYKFTDNDGDSLIINKSDTYNALILSIVDNAGLFKAVRIPMRSLPEVVKELNKYIFSERMKK